MTSLIKQFGGVWRYQALRLKSSFLRFHVRLSPRYVFLALCLSNEFAELEHYRSKEFSAAA